MNKVLILFPFLLFSCIIFAQDVKRVEISGKIIVKDNDVEGVTVYNTSSEKGTITNFDGDFKIEAGLNDRIEVSALQFKKFIVIVDEKIIEQQKMTVLLIEAINKLPEVIVSPYDLSGNIVVDTERVRVLNLPIEIDMGSAPIDLTSDYKTGVYNPFVRGAGGKADMLGGDVLGLVGLILKPLFKKKKKKSNSENYNDLSDQDKEVYNLRLMYTNDYMAKSFGIPEDKVNAFIAYVEDNGLDYSLLNNGREMEFIDFLVQQSKSFLDLQGEKN